MHIIDPLDEADASGRAVGQIPVFLDQFCRGFGESLLNNCRVCERIDFLYNHSTITPKEFEKVIESGISDGILWFRDIANRYRGLAIALFRGLEAENNVYAVRHFNNSPSEVTGEDQHIIAPDNATTYHNVLEDEDQFWRFHREDRRTKIFERSQAFFDLYLTRAAVNLLVWTTNILGFGKNQKRPLKSSHHYGKVRM